MVQGLSNNDKGLPGIAKNRINEFCRPGSPPKSDFNTINTNDIAILIMMTIHCCKSFVNKGLIFEISNMHTRRDRQTNKPRVREVRQESKTKINET